YQKRGGTRCLQHFFQSLRASGSLDNGWIGTRLTPALARLRTSPGGNLIANTKPHFQTPRKPLVSPTIGMVHRQKDPSLFCDVFATSSPCRQAQDALVGLPS